MRLNVYEDHLLILCDPFTEKSKGGLYLPEAHSERSRKATVILVGPDVKDYAVGDRIVVSRHAGVYLHLPDDEIDGVRISEERTRVIREGEALAKIMEE